MKARLHHILLDIIIACQRVAIAWRRYKQYRREQMYEKYKHLMGE